MKIVINRCYGGFGLSLQATKRYLELKGLPCYFYKQTKHSFQNGVDEYSLLKDCENDNLFICTFTQYFGEKFNIEKLSREDWQKYNFYDRDIERNDPILIQVIEELGDKASGRYSKLRIVEIPDDVQWEIEEYDGQEWVSEKHKTWE